MEVDSTAVHLCFYPQNKTARSHHFGFNLCRKLTLTGKILQMRINNPIQPVLPNISSYIHRLLKHWWQPTDMNKHEKQPADGLHPTPVHAADKRCDRSRSWISSKENKSVIANFSSSGQADRHEHHTKRYCPNGISPMENSDCLPRGEPAAKSRATQPTVHVGCYSVSIFSQTLTWITATWTCAQM